LSPFAGADGDVFSDQDLAVILALCLSLVLKIASVSAGANYRIKPFDFRSFQQLNLFLDSL